MRREAGRRPRPDLASALRQLSQNHLGRGRVAGQPISGPPERIASGALSVGTLAIIDLGGDRVVDQGFLDTAVDRAAAQCAVSERAELILHAGLARNLEAQ